MAKRLGTELRRMREERGLSLRDVERASNVLLGAIGKIERGDVESPGILTLVPICQAIGITVNDLLIAAELMDAPDEYRRPAGAPDVGELKKVLRSLDRVRGQVAGLISRQNHDDDSSDPGPETISR